MNEKSYSPSVSTEITFGLVGDGLRVAKITNSLGFEPTRCFEKGDLYVGRRRIDGSIQEVERRRPRGVWQFSTLSTLSSDLIVEHAELLIAKLEPLVDQIRRFRESDNLFVRVSICHVGSGSFELSSKTFKRLSELCDEISITCWESEALEETSA